MSGCSAARAVLVTCIGASSLLAQTSFYRGTDVTGRMVRTAVTNVSQTGFSFRTSSLRLAKPQGPEFKSNIVEPQRGRSAGLSMKMMKLFAAPNQVPGYEVQPTSPAFSFLGLTHFDQRNANNGNQFSVEPPSPDIAAAKGWILEGVNNAIQVYSTAGAPLLPKVLSTNELFGVAPAIDRNTGVNGVFPTDMRVHYDHGIDRWFIVQRAQGYDVFGNPLNTSKLYMAVSQTGDPTGSYNIYTMDTTNATRPGCPCYSDFPQIGADQHGLYISVDEYNTSSGLLADVSILALPKAQLAAGATTPRVVEFVLPRRSGFEATVRPAVTPPGASYAEVRGGIQFFMSTHSLNFDHSEFSLWALTNTASLNNAVQDLTLQQTVIPGMPYTFPFEATQRPGPLPFGSTLSPPGLLAQIHGGRDSRVLSLAYVAGRLYVTFATNVLDKSGKNVVAGGYAVLFPSLRGLTLSAPVWQSGYIAVAGNHVLRPAVAVTPQGRGAIAFTLVGPDYFPSAALIPVEGFLPSGKIQIVSAGVAPEDGFTGYPDLGFSTVGIARWGDYSGAVATADGSIWMTTEYIPAAPRTELANWGTRIIRYKP